jgi:hypothetical protein
MIPTDHREIIASAAVVAAFVVTTIATAVGTMTYLIFRERALAPAAATKVVPKPAAVREPEPVRMPAAVAG